MEIGTPSRCVFYEADQLIYGDAPGMDGDWLILETPNGTRLGILVTAELRGKLLRVLGDGAALDRIDLDGQPLPPPRLN
jgi:hypothetical protein